MFNALPFNVGEFNGSGVLQKIVDLGSTVAVDVSSTPPDMIREAGLASAATVDVSATPPTLQQRITGSANVSVDVTSNVAMYRVVELAASVTLTTAGLIGGGIVWALEGSASTDVHGELLPFDFLAEASVQTDVTTAADLTKIRVLAGTGAVTAAADPMATVGQRRMFSDVSVIVTGTASQDTTIGGVRYAELGTNTTVDVDAECLIDPTKFLYVDALVETSATGGYTRIRHYFGANLIDVIDDSSLYVYKGALGSEVSVDVTSQVVMRRTATLAAAVGVGVDAEPVIVKGDRNLSGDAVVDVLRAAGVLRTASMATQSSVDVSGFGDVRPAQRLEAAANVGVEVNTSADLTYFTLHLLSADASIDVDAVVTMDRITDAFGESSVDVDGEATLRINLLSFEPDYRTVTVETENNLFAVEPENFTVIVADDGGAMQTFQKQPAEVLPYDVDFAQWFAGIDAQGDATDDIDTATADIVSATSGPTSSLAIDDVIVVRTDPDDASSPGYRVKVWLSGGTNGVTYKLTVRMTSNAGRVKEQDFKLKIKEL